MRAFLFIAIACALSACTPPQPGPEDVVREAYAQATARLAQGQITDADHVPMTPDLRTDLDHALSVAQARNEPFIDGDLIANCQDCQHLTVVTVVTTTPAANGRAVVEAHFKLDGNDRVVIWEMMQTPQGWRVDNLKTADGYDLRGAIQQEVALENISCTQDRGAEAANELVAQCSQVSPATHPPCNAENTCAVIEAEIARACGMLTGASKPAFCASGQ